MPHLAADGRRHLALGRRLVVWAVAENAVLLAIWAEVVRVEAVHALVARVVSLPAVTLAAK